MDCHLTLSARYIYSIFKLQILLSRWRWATAHCLFVQNYKEFKYYLVQQTILKFDVQYKGIVITGTSLQYRPERLMLMFISLKPERSKFIQALSWLDSSPLPQETRFNAMKFHVVFVVEKVTLVQVVFQVLQGFPYSVIPHYITIN